MAVVDARPRELAGQQAGRAGRQAVRPGQGERDRQRLLVLAQVVADRLAGDGRLAPDAEQVVDRLEGDAEVAAEVGRAPRRVRRGARPGWRPIAAAQDSSAPVLPASICEALLDRERVASSKAMSSAWPAIIACVASARRPAAPHPLGRRLVQEHLEGQGRRGRRRR